ncbi:hypothetical protein B0F90DRAFT_661043 [Multifurca ochricompacta]|uniref:Uncharacterized protein n=1 Tax=Multifurca ochricompacta TaxID=376703 RepID=A0AAD4M2M7_9AGAM|nr:hypothetical protein B0F90DRAFT_661043 [Multifurca ochricompacta]
MSCMVLASQVPHTLASPPTFPLLLLCPCLEASKKKTKTKTKTKKGLVGDHRSGFETLSPKLAKHLLLMIGYVRGAQILSWGVWKT